MLYRLTNAETLRNAHHGISAKPRPEVRQVIRYALTARYGGSAAIGECQAVNPPHKAPSANSSSQNPAASPAAFNRL